MEVKIDFLNEPEDDIWFESYVFDEISIDSLDLLPDDLDYPIYGIHWLTGGEPKIIQLKEGRFPSGFIDGQGNFVSLSSQYLLSSNGDGYHHIFYLKQSAEEVEDTGIVDDLDEYIHLEEVFPYENMGRINVPLTNGDLAVINSVLQEIAEGKYTGEVKS